MSAEPADLKIILTEGLREMGLHKHVVNQALDDLLRFVLLLIKWNRVYNLTAVRDPKQMVRRHVLDSLSLHPFLPQSGLLIDVGSGAGLPVLPLAIAHRGLEYYSVEANGKKARFQQQAILELGISKVTVINQRIEDVQLVADCVTSRAFRNPLELLHTVDRLCAPGSRVLIMLGKAERMPAVMPPHFRLDELQKTTLPGMEAERHVAVCRRIDD